jgi:hypothetical protein
MVYRLIWERTPIVFAGFFSLFFIFRHEIGYAGQGIFGGRKYIYLGNNRLFSKT